MIGAYLVDTVTLRQDKGNDQWQEPNTPTDVSMKARIDYEKNRIENAMGQMIMSSAVVMMRPRTIIRSDFSTRATNTISYKDKLIFDGVAHSIVKISKMKDFSVRGIKVYVT